MTEVITNRLFAADKETAISFIRREIRTGTPEEHLEDIFSDSVSLLYDKYLSDGSVGDYIRARKLLYGIIKIKIKQYKRLMADVAFFGHKDESWGSKENFLSANSTTTTLKPPSYYYARDYRKRPEVYARWLEWSREYYWKNHAKMLARERDPKRKARRNANTKLWYSAIKADPERHAEYLAKRRIWRNAYRRRKKQGTYVDRRYFANKEVKPAKPRKKEK